MKEGTISGTSQSHNPESINTIRIPPDFLEIPEANDEVIDYNVITKLSAKLHEHLKSDLTNHIQCISDKMVAELENKINNNNP